MIAHDLLSYQIEKALRSLELNLTQMSLLNHFFWQPEKAQTITELAKVMGINQPGITKQLMRWLINVVWLKKILQKMHV